MSPIGTKASLYHRRGRQKRNKIAGTNIRSLKYPNQKARNYISLPKLNWITGALPWKSWFVLLYNLVFSSNTTNHEQNILNYCSCGILWKGVMDILEVAMTLMAMHCNRNLKMFEICLKWNLILVAAILKIIFSHLHAFEKWQINVIRTINLLLLHTTGMCLSSAIAVHFNHIPSGLYNSIQIA